MQANQNRRVLPPGIEDDVIFGIMWIRVGILKNSKTALPIHSVAIMFWGQTTPARLSTSSQNPQTQQYEIRCPVTLFEKYVLDMKKSLQIEVEGLGFVSLDLSTHLKPNITLATKSPFDHFKGFFEVKGKDQKKVASLELELCANFSPEVAQRELGEALEQEAPASSKEHIVNRYQKRPSPKAQHRQNSKQNNQVEAVQDHRNNAQFCQNRQHLNINALDVLAIEKPELFREFYEESKTKAAPRISKPVSNAAVTDQRIPNSLNIEPNQAVFEPQKYEQVVTPPGREAFPMVEKVLTYSNLRLEKNMQGQISPPSQPARPPNAKLGPTKGVTTDKKLALEPTIQQERKGETKPLMQEPLQMSSLPKNKQSKEDRDGQQRGSKQVQQLFSVGDVKREPSLSELSQVNKINDSVSVEARKEILSRVIHLDEELQKDKIREPQKKVTSRPLAQISPQPISLNRNLPNLPAFQTQVPFNSVKPKSKKSSLLLSMMVQIERASINLPKSRFIVRFRPYGERQFVKLGPQLDKIVTLMFPIGESQVLKMAKMPFILEFWGIGDQQFIGMVKLQLGKVYKGYVLDGRLNQLAIKTSLLPTVIHKGNIPIKDLKEQPCGECHLSAHIGTSLQLQTYLSTPKPQQQSIPQTLPPLDIQNKQEAPVQIKRREQGKLQDWTSFLEMLVDNSQACKAAFALCFERQYLSQADLSKLFDAVNFKGGDPFRLMEDQGIISCQQMSLCFQDCNTAKKELIKMIKRQISILSGKDLSELKQKIRAQSRLGLIRKQSLLRINSIKEYLPLTSTALPDIIEEEHFLQTLSNPDNQSYQFSLSPEACSIIVPKIFVQGSHLLDLEKILQMNAISPLVRLQSLRGGLLKKGGAKYSKWFWLQLTEALYKAHGESRLPQDQNINIVLLYNWLLVSERQQQKQPRHSNEDKLIQLYEDPGQRQRIREGQEQQRIEQKHQQPQRNASSLQPRQIEAVLKQNAEMNQSPSPTKHQPTQKKAEEVSSGVYEHRFVIALQELHLQEPEQGNCIVSYQFPLQPENVEAKTVKIQADKHAYKLHSIATHTLTLSGSLDSHLAENPLALSVQLPSNRLTGHIHPAELTPEIPTLKAVPLFHPEHSGIAGKIKLTVSYTRSETSRAIGSQTTQELFLPKTGYLNYNLESQIDPAKIKQQLSLPSQFYVQLWLDPFGNSPSLAVHYPPVHSALISDFSASITLSGSYKVTMTPTLLEHFKDGSWTSKVVVIYYQKSGGNYERRQVVVGSCTAPLLPAIRREGLLGDYAFKNKIGMFLALGSVSLRYQKKAQIQTGRHIQIEKTNFWIVIDFTEIINFQRDLGWIKFEVVCNGKRLSTEKTYLKHLGFHNLTQRCLLLHLAQEEMASLKILPIKVLTAQKQYAIDINLRPTAKQLQSHSHHAEGQYLLVVDQHSQTAKLRIGVKTYAFRGPSMVAPLVEAISNNPPRLNVDLPSLSNQPQPQYREMLQQLRKVLKLSSSTFENIVQRLLDRSKKQKLSSIFFTSIQPTLDLTPIFSKSRQEVQQIGEELPSQVSMQDLLEYLKENGMQLGNLRRKSLERYSFARLNSTKFDQNIEYIGLHEEIDLLLFLKKIKIEPDNEDSQIQTEELHQKERELKITLIRGFDFHLLYNGIKPNPLLKLPQLSFTTQTSPRTSEPIFNSSITIALPKSSVDIAIQAYHAPGNSTQEILIGQGTLSINQFLDSSKNSFSKTYRVVLHSAMSNRLQAAVDVKVELSNAESREREKGQEEREIEENQSVQASIEDEQIEQALNRINKNDYGTKGVFFESSDQEY